MAKYERGSYEPEDVRVFDGGHDDEDTEGSHLPMVIVISLLVLAAFGGVVWLAYNNGVAHGRGDVPTHIVAQNTAAAPATAPDASPATPVRTIKVYQQPAGADEDTEAPATAPPAQLNKVVTPAPVLRSQPAETKPVAAQTAPVQTKPAPVKATVVETKKPVVPPSVAVTQSTLSPVKTQPKAVATPPAALTPAKPAATAPVTVAGAFVLQIGAYKSEADASAAWKVYQAKHAALLSGVSSNIEKADLGSKGVWYRLRAGSFAGKDEAAALCDKLKAEGAACFPAK